VTQDHFGNGAVGAAIALFLTELVAVGIGIAIVGGVVFDRRTVRRVALRDRSRGGHVSRRLRRAPRCRSDSVNRGGGRQFLLLAYALRLFTAEEVALMRSGIDRQSGKVRIRRAGVAAGEPS
jgi:hypothetical protein